MSRSKRTGSDHLTGFCRQNGWLIGTIAVFSMVVNALMLTGPVFMLQVYDRVLGSGSEETLVSLMLIVAFLFGVLGLLDFARSRIGLRYGARLQVALERSVFRASLADARATGTHPQALGDLAQIQRFITTPVFMALFDLPWTLFFIGAIFLFHSWLGWLALAGLAVLVAVTLLNRAASLNAIARSGVASGAAERIAFEMQAQSDLIQSLGMQGAAFARWQRQRHMALSEAIRSADLVGGFSAVTRTLRLFLQSAILGLGAYLVLQGQLTAGAMIAASILLGRALAPVEMVIGQWSMIAEAGQSWRRLERLLQKQPAEPVRIALPQPAARLNVNQVSIIPPGGTAPTLRGVCLQVQPGQAVGVIGASGSGKSTLARALTSIWSASTGQIRLDGATLDQYPPEDLGRYIGYLPQSVSLFEGTVSENIARLDAEADDLAIVKAARAAAAHDMILTLPDGYNTRVSGCSAGLSGGQIQRIGLARALYGDPVLLVLDEPNASLDSDGSLALNKAVNEVKARGGAALIMAHRPSAIKGCDKLLVLSDGAPVMFGPTQEVLRKTLTNYSDLQQVMAGQGAVA